MDTPKEIADGVRKIAKQHGMDDEGADMMSLATLIGAMLGQAQAKAAEEPTCGLPDVQAVEAERGSDGS